MNLVWSFTTMMEGYKDVETVLNLYKASMIRARQFNYQIKFYGCDYSIEYLKGYYDTCVDVSNEEFILTDDLKIYIHSKEGLDCMTIDGDLILYSPLDMRRLQDFDVIFECPETTMTALHPKRKNDIGYLFILDTLKKYNIGETIKEYKDNNDLATNVGIIKFNNQQIKDLFLKRYYDFRELYLSTIEPMENLIDGEYVPSIVICQYLYGCLVNYHKINVGYTKPLTSYIHYYGLWKFHPNTTRSITKIINGSKLKKSII